MKLNLRIGLLMCFLCTSGLAADFDGDGVADEFTINMTKEFQAFA